MNKKVVTIILLVLLALLLGAGSCTIAQSKYSEEHFTISGGEIYQLNIYAEEGQTIIGS
ncbi:unnamed protein product [marine sediment metagenome]|uniref:Uncharacterized protein n=1 Tax=marine sediment metagenome TaxID=412755 RepID=X1T4J0_9ZZZZ